ncbi:MAG: hypothetical protein EOO25_13195 [Comamonadaceae bacterium]|nr:MAG: hypothetical protein EOO25_13195 [Comamonadaceae bacterium]
MRYLLSAWSMALGLLLAAASALAQPAVLEIGGAVAKPLALTRADLQALARRDYSEERTVTQDGKQAQLAIRYQGVPLKELLDRAGLQPDRREIRKAVVLLTAKDGYQASFSWGELYNSALGDGVILVLRQGETDLLEADGLPALRSLQDLRSGPRHVRWLVRIDVLVPQK